MTKQNLLKWGALCLMAFIALAAKAQNITATWDFQNRIPASLATVALQGNTGYVESDIEGINLYVDATNGKFNVKDRTSDVQVNQGTIIQVPVQSADDVVSVTSYPGYHNYTVGGIDATADVTDHDVTMAESQAGYVEIVATGSVYLYKISVTFASKIQEKELYATDFSEWTTVKASADETLAHEANTKYSHESLSFSVYQTNVAPNPDDIGIDWNKFDKDSVGGTLQAAKNGGAYITTSALASVSKVYFVHGATGGNRGWSLWAKGDGDADWVQVSTAVANPAGWSPVTATVNRTNCQLKFTNINDPQNAYMFRLHIYGNVDMSLTPALGSFTVNGATYYAADIFNEDAEGNMVATVEISKQATMISESNPLGDITTDNGDLTSVTYETTADGEAVVKMVVEANGQALTYILNVVYKPDYTITYIDTDGTTVIDATQLVEKDSKIGTFTKGEADVTVADGKKFRGWFVETEGGRKYTVDEVVTSDLNLYAVATDIETESTTKRYTFDLTDKYFYDEDHEAFNAEGAEFHDSRHGWVLEPDGAGKIDLLVGGHAYIILGLCNQGGSRNITLSDASGNVISTINGKASADGATSMIEYDGPAGTLTLTATTSDTYIHKIVIANVEDAPVEKNEQGYYVVRAGDGGNLLTVLDIVNTLPAEEGRAYVFLPAGTYDLGNEVLTPISRDNISIIGESTDNTTIVNEAPEEGIGVSATFLVTAKNTYFQDVTLQNAYDYYQPGFAGRAVVIQDKGNRTICKNVRMLSYQDTYYSNANSQFYFETSDIHGTVDFICGGGDVFFNNCTLTVEPRNADGSGACTLTAPATDVNGGNKWGYVFSGCTINSLAQSFNYGRAWQNKPRCAYINTTLLQPSRLNSNRWTTGGMGTVADKFVEYNTMDETGKVISPAEFSLTFTYNTQSNTYNTILTEAEAETYALENVFTNWTPAEYAAQKTMGLLRSENGTALTWDAVEGAKAYAVFNDGVFIGMTSTNYFDQLNGAAIDKITVRAANEYGGFGAASSTTSTGISSVATDAESVVNKAYYNLQGVRVSNDYKGVVIEVSHMADGNTVTKKMINK